ncbi:hypothetical protein [Nocardia tengchongensis]
MGIILATTVISLVLFIAAVAGRVVDGTRQVSHPLTVADIQARLAAEPPRTYHPISRGW